MAHSDSACDQKLYGLGLGPTFIDSWIERLPSESPEFRDAARWLILGRDLYEALWLPKVATSSFLELGRFHRAQRESTFYRVMKDLLETWSHSLVLAELELDEIVDASALEEWQTIGEVLTRRRTSTVQLSQLANHRVLLDPDNDALQYALGRLNYLASLHQEAESTRRREGPRQRQSQERR